MKKSFSNEIDKWQARIGVWQVLSFLGPEHFKLIIGKNRQVWRAPSVLIMIPHSNSYMTEDRILNSIRARSKYIIGLKLN